MYLGQGGGRKTSTSCRKPGKSEVSPKNQLLLRPVEQIQRRRFRPVEIEVRALVVVQLLTHQRAGARTPILDRVLRRLLVVELHKSVRKLMIESQSLAKRNGV